MNKYKVRAKAWQTLIVVANNQSEAEDIARDEAFVTGEYEREIEKIELINENS